jgi:hypothetical protein
MDYRTRFKRFYSVFTICWLGVCLAAGIAVSSAPVRETLIPTPSGHAPPAGEWASYTRNLLQGMTGSEYEAMRKSYFFRSVAATVWEAGRSISSVGYSLVAGTERPGNPQYFGFVARLMSTRGEDLLAWLAVTIIPPVLVYVLGFIAVPKIAGAFKSGELSE